MKVGNFVGCKVVMAGNWDGWRILSISVCESLQRKIGKRVLTVFDRNISRYARRKLMCKAINFDSDSILSVQIKFVLT